MSRPHKNPGAAASVAQAPSGPYTSISDVERRVIENAGTGEALVRLDRKITDGLNLVHERIRDLSKDIKDARSEHRADFAELKDMNQALDAKVEANRERDRSEHRADMAELKDMIRALDAKVEANRERDRSDHRADMAELKDMIRALDAKVEANRERDRSDHRADMAELKDMIRALAAEGAANRELVGEVRAMRRLVWILAGIILGIGIAAALGPAVANAAFSAIFGG